MWMTTFITIFIFKLLVEISRAYYAQYGDKEYGILLLCYHYGIKKFCIRFKRPIIIILKITGFVSFILLLVFLRSFPNIGIKFHLTPYPINYLYMPEELFLIQSSGNCAPYSAMAAIHILRGDTINPEGLARETGWRIDNNETFPQGLIDLLNSYNINTREYILWALNDLDKIQWLKMQIDSGFPVILLIKLEGVQHYITVIGYDELGFMIYDSAQERSEEDGRLTIIDREEYAGNRYFINAELMRLWSQGGIAFFFRHWAVVCYIEEAQAL